MAGRAAENTVRIIAGSWRGRRLAVADVDGLRPSGDRIRETLFNWLAPHLPGARVLDLFAGSGVLGFEALSRGADFATLVEKHPQVARQLQQNGETLAANCEVLARDARRLIASPPTDGRYDIVFIDPPFADKDAMQLCTLLLQNRWLHDDSLVYVEQPKRDSVPPVAGFMTVREKHAGQVQFGLYTADPEGGQA